MDPQYHGAAEGNLHEQVSRTRGEEKNFVPPQDIRVGVFCIQSTHRQL
jgi:hypothetical protein